MDTYYDLETDSRNAVKTAVLLAKQAYDERFSSFVKNSSSRLEFIDDRIVSLANEFALQLDADPAEVLSFLRSTLADAVEVTQFEKENVEDGDGEIKNSDTVPAQENSAETGIDTTEAVLEVQDSTEVDLNSETAKSGDAFPVASAKDKKDDDEDEDDDEESDETLDDADADRASGEGEKLMEWDKEHPMKDSFVITAHTEPGNPSDESTWHSCFRCEQPLNPVQASLSPVCVDCTDELLSKVARKALEVVAFDDGRVVETIPLQDEEQKNVEKVTMGLLTKMDRDSFFVREVDLPDPAGDPMAQDVPPDQGEAGGGVDPVPPVAPMGSPEGENNQPSSAPSPLSSFKNAAMPLDPNQQCKCDYCPFTGSLPAVQLHEQQAHADQLRAQQTMDKGELNQAQLPVAPQNMSFGSAIDKQIKGPNSNPSDVFEDRVQTMANYQAAAAWSTVSDDDVQKISSQFGLDPAQVKDSLICVATFGGATAVNGSEGVPSPDTAQFTQLHSFGGQVPTTEEQVDVPMAIQATAHELGIEEGDVQNSISDSYGGDLGSKYYISVSGTASYFLPKDMVPEDNNPSAKDVPTSPDQPPVDVGQGPMKLQTKLISRMIVDGEYEDLDE